MSLITLFQPEEPRAKRSCGQRIQKGWLDIKQTASGFSGALLLSTAFHLFLSFLSYALILIVVINVLSSTINGIAFMEKGI